MSVILYNHFRSSASWRVRIALNWKGVAFEYVPISLVTGEHRTAEYRAHNPLQAVPTLAIDGHELSESLAIIEYLEETRSEPPLLPKGALDRALVRRLAEAFNAGTQPLQNLRVLNRLESQFGADAAAKKVWVAHFVTEILGGVEQLMQSSAGQFSFGDRVSVADVCLIPQLYGARRFGVDLTKFPTISRVEQQLNVLPAFERARPALQPDCPPEER